ncbi:MAG: cellulase family glycosylhydrolase [Bacteroidetes bacterium]|nr:cellulase family glycosylhydrolase [Bacteroidota bacterium]
MKQLHILLLILLPIFTHAQQWPREKAQQWYAAQPWLVGANFIPSTAINQLEMWQAETFDTVTIDRELGFAEGIGMNTARVFLHDLAYEADPIGFKHRVDVFLAIAARHGIRPLLVFFDDCWGEAPKIGKQPDPIPGIHNSGWMQSPGKVITLDSKVRTDWPRLEHYVKDVLTTFRDDKRILLWDLYNEPGNSGRGTRTLPLLRAIFTWARAVNPSQPLTAGLYNGNKTMNNFQTSNSDIITFHNYNDTTALVHQIEELQAYDRPLICTEWMARTTGHGRKVKHSRIETHLPIFKRYRVGCINWGLVSGKTQTIYHWGSKQSNDPPAEWFHDIFYKDGKPYKQTEVDVFRVLTGR